MDYGITSKGFIRKSYEVLLEELQTFVRSAEIFGETIDLSDYSIIGAQLKLMAWALSRQWELAEETYYSFDIDQAEGVALNRLTRLGFVSKRGALRARGYLLFRGGSHCTIPPGTQVETETGIVFVTIIFGITDETGSVTIEAECIELGTIGNVSAGNISKIKTPVAGIDSVTNPLPFRSGRNIETDYEQRARFKALPLAAGSSLDAIIVKVLNVPHVMDAIGYENVENIIIDDIMPGAIEIVVEEGDGEEIAKTIFSSKPAGINTSGNTEMTVHDSRGRAHLIRFSRPENVEVYVEYVLSVDANFDPDYIPNIKEATVASINNLPIAATLFSWKLCNLLYGITGIVNARALVGLTEDQIVTDRLIPSSRQVYKTSITKVVVSYEQS